MALSKTAKYAIAANAPVGRVYGVSWTIRCFALVYLLVACFISSRIIGPRFDTDEPIHIWLLLLVGIFPLVGVGISVAAFTSRIRIHEAAIEREALWGSRSIAFTAIKGRREFTLEDTEGGSTRFVRLESNDDSPDLVFGKGRYQFDDTFWAWYRQIPSLNPEDHKDSNFGLL